jgi:hypothetical protein
LPFASDPPLGRPAATPITGQGTFVERILIGERRRGKGFESVASSSRSSIQSAQKNGLEARFAGAVKQRETCLFWVGEFEQRYLASTVRILIRARRKNNLPLSKTFK